VEQVGARADAVLSRVRPLLAGGDVVLVSHAHFLRILAARWLGLPPDDGRLLRLDTGTLSTLGIEHGQPVVLMWNAPPAPVR
jgi:probable phosphoglycerate mutase